MNDSSECIPCPLHEDLVSAATEFAAGLQTALRGLGLGDASPTEVGKRLGLDKSLAWKLTQVAHSADAGMILEQLPGVSALRIFVSALERRSVRAEVIGAVQAGADRIENAIARHAGDRATLELLLDSVGGRRKARLETSRKLAFRGNSGIWGLQARARVQVWAMYPNADDPDWVDVAMVGGWVDFRRLRAGTRWSLFRRTLERPASEAGGAPVEIPLDPRSDRDLMLLPDFCDGNLPDILPVVGDGATAYEIGPTPVGNTGAFNCYLGAISPRNGSRYGESPGDCARMFAHISAPTEQLHAELYIHRDLGLGCLSTASIYGSMSPGSNSFREGDLIPTDDRVQPLGPLTSLDSAVAIPSYPALLKFVFDRVGRSHHEFMGHRLAMEHPPFPATAVLSVPLLTR
jgi:hypothetical protein